MPQLLMLAIPRLRSQKRPRLLAHALQEPTRCPSDLDPIIDRQVIDPAVALAPNPGGCWLLGLFLLGLLGLCGAGFSVLWALEDMNLRRPSPARVLDAEAPHVARLLKLGEARSDRP